MEYDACKERAKYNAKRPVEVLSQKLSRPIAKWIIERRLNVDIIGSEKKPKDISFMEVFNHAAYADGLILGTYEQKTIHFWIQKEDPEKRLSIARRMLYNFLIWVWGHIEISVLKENKAKLENKKALERSIGYLNSGKDIIGLFPEGPTLRSREYVKNGKRPPLHRGAAYMALAANKPIVPIGVYIDVPEHLQPIVFDRTKENERIIGEYIKKNGKLNYRIAIGDPIYVQNKNNKNCELVIGELEKPISVKKVYFENQKELETILTNEAMEQCYRLADPNNVEGKLNNGLFLSGELKQKQYAY